MSRNPQPAQHIGSAKVTTTTHMHVHSKRVEHHLSSTIYHLLVLNG